MISIPMWMRTSESAARPVRHAGTRPANLRASGHDHGFPSEPADGKGIPQPHEARSPRL